MHIISRKRLLLFFAIHADVEAPLDTWYRAAKTAQLKNLAELKLVFSSADLVDEYTVFKRPVGK
jgi:mRNA interferase HigB